MNTLKFYLKFEDLHCAKNENPIRYLVNDGEFRCATFELRESCTFVCLCNVYPLLVQFGGHFVQEICWFHLWLQFWRSKFIQMMHHFRDKGRNNFYIIGAFLNLESSSGVKYAYEEIILTHIGSIWTHQSIPRGILKIAHHLLGTFTGKQVCCALAARDNM